MGTVQHTAIIVTGFDMTSGPKKLQLQMKKMLKVAIDLFGKKSVSNLLGAGVNGYRSFMVAPCGSKLGWEDSVEFLETIDKFTRIMDTFVDKDENTFNYAKVSYGELSPSIYCSGPYRQEIW